MTKQFPDVNDMKKKLADRLKVVSEENEEKKKVLRFSPSLTCEKC